MSTEHTTVQKRTATERLDVTLGTITTPRLGIDSWGAVHYYDDAENRVIVTDEDDHVVHIEELGDRTTDDWMSEVAGKRGWDVAGAEGFARQLLALGGR